jgi:hypothetical protein
MSLVKHKQRSKLNQWLLNENRPAGGHHQTHIWWQVMCLTGVDYFSTLGYQPGIAALAAGQLSPIATLILVLVTLFGALPIYRRVATISPHGEGSISMLAQLLSWWWGKAFVLCLLGFVATDFIITITLSASDAAAHIVENSLIHDFVKGQEVTIALLLITLLCGVFLRGFQEAIGIAVVLVVVYLGLNLVTIGAGIQHIIADTSVLAKWQQSLFIPPSVLAEKWQKELFSQPLGILAILALIFPKLALGLSGFETGVAVMPLVEGNPGETEENPAGRIKNTYKLLTAAALIMSVFLLSSSLVTTLLISPAEFAKGGLANGRALAFLSHKFLGDGFGTVYDLSTIAILWFAGASAMAGLLNIVPRYLPRYGMAPDWARATRPLVLVFTAIAFIVTIVFKANVDAQAGAYATGVLVLMSSAAFAVTLSVRKSIKPSTAKIVMFAAITLVFIYTTVINTIERPDGIIISGIFIGTIVLTSLFSRVMRSTELRVENIEIDEAALNFIAEDSKKGTVRLIANRKQAGDENEYLEKEKEVREDNHIPATDSVLFLEIQIVDASQFVETVRVEGVQVGEYRILRAKGAAVPNTIAAILLDIRDRNPEGRYPHAYFGWVEGNPAQYLARFLFLGEGDTAVVTREVIRTAEPDPNRRPGIHVGG